MRQQLSSTQIIRYVQDPERLKTVQTFPITVYALSLALSVCYQHLRYGRLPSEQDDARHHFNTGCRILQELRKTWQAADPIATLAHRISIALNNLPNLDMLCINRPYHLTNEAGQEPNPDMPLNDCSNDAFMPLSGSETMDLFGGMDDLSWMYLDAENPISFDNLPLSLPNGL